MEKVTKKQKSSVEIKHPLDRKFSSIEEAAKAKTDYLMNTVFKNANWDSLQK